MVEATKEQKDRIMDITGIDLDKIKRSSELADSLADELKGIEKTATDIGQMPQGEKKKRAIVLLEDIKAKVEDTNSKIKAMNDNLSQVPILIKMSQDIKNKSRNIQITQIALFLLIAVGFLLLLLK